MSSTQFHIDSRAYTQKLNIHPSKNTLIELSYLSVMDVIGEKAQEFLQGQLTADVREVTPLSMRQSAFCDLKGRILTLLDMIDWNGIHCILPEDLFEKTTLSLSKTALLSRVKLQKNSTLCVFGFILNSAPDLTPGPLPVEYYEVIQQNDYCCYRLSERRFIIIIPLEHKEAFMAPFAANQQIQGTLTWHEQQLCDHDFELYPASRGLFLPHRLGLHKTHRISFNKGCYKGQEIIARTHYRAVLKHAMAYYNITTTEHLYPGQRLLEQHTNREVGELIDYCPIGEHQYLIAVSLLLEHPLTCTFENHQQSVELKPALL